MEVVAVPKENSHRAKYTHTQIDTHRYKLKLVQDIQILSKLVYVTLQFLNFTILQENTSFSTACQ